MLMLLLLPLLFFPLPGASVRNQRRLLLVKGWFQNTRAESQLNKWDDNAILQRNFVHLYVPVCLFMGILCHGQGKIARRAGQR
jgi:hypothetical protein